LKSSPENIYHHFFNTRIILRLVGEEIISISQYSPSPLENIPGLDLFITFASVFECLEERNLEFDKNLSL